MRISSTLLALSAAASVIATGKSCRKVERPKDPFGQSGYGHGADVWHGSEERPDDYTGGHHGSVGGTWPEPSGCNSHCYDNEEPHHDGYGTDIVASSETWSNCCKPSTYTKTSAVTSTEIESTTLTETKPNTFTETVSASKSRSSSIDAESSRSETSASSSTRSASRQEASTSVSSASTSRTDPSSTSATASSSSVTESSSSSGSTSSTATRQSSATTSSVGYSSVGSSSSTISASLTSQTSSTSSRASASSSTSAQPTNQCNGTQDAEYEYIVVGSGAGGGPLAARLAIAGHKTLLIEAGDDQGANDNYTVPAYQAKSTEDPQMAWDFFVRHYQDETQERRDYKLTYTTPGEGEYTGLNPPPGSEIKGVLYPRSATLGGCTAHNALITVYPHRVDYEYMEALTGDPAWGPDAIRRLFVRMEALGYLQGAIDVTGHGLNGWFGTAFAPIELALEDLQLTSQLVGASFALGNFTGTPLNLVTLLTGDPNADSELRDSTPALYQIPIASANRKRNGSREFLIAVRDAIKADGTKRYPLDIKMNTHVTKVNFCNNGTTPRATGVDYLEGKGIYKASKLNGGRGTRGSVRASREVIVAGGSYNSPQILKLSGIGPAAELSRFGIPVVKDAPGVGSNLQDHYEVSVQATFPNNNFTTLDDCTFGFFGQPDPCLDRWKQDPRIQGVTYDSSGFAAAAFFKSSATPDGNYDVFAFGGPVNFRGYFPNYSVNATIEHNWWSWALLKGHPQNAAGAVTLRSADPLDVPDIQFNFFQDGADTDLQAIYESITFGRDAFARQPVPYVEQQPGQDLDTRAELFQWIKDVAWSHHCSSTVKIGRDDDPMAVLDSKFRVRGVQGLRVVDASVYPKIPGTFTAVSTYLVGEKAADDILNELGEVVETPLGLILRLGDATVGANVDINNLTALLQGQVDQLRLGELGLINLNITLGGNRG